MPETDGPLAPEPLMQVSEMHAILVAVDQLGERLRTEQTAFLNDPECDETNEVLLGLASRMYRLLSGFLARPTVWVPDTAALHLRPLVDARILAGWLLVKERPGDIRGLPFTRARAAQAAPRTHQGGSWRRSAGGRTRDA